MKTTTVLFSIALAFKTIYSRTIAEALYGITNQLNVSKGDNSSELVESNNFVYKFHCSEEKELCDKIKNNLAYATKTISNTFEIYKPITFEVFVDDLSKYGLTQTLAGVLDINYIPLKESRNSSTPTYVYAQSLAKQLKLNKQNPNYKANDFTMIVNNCNSIPEKKDNELRSIMIHEIFHGLGFASLARLSKLTDSEENDPYSKGSKLDYNEDDQYTITPDIIPSYNKKLLEITNEEEYDKEILNTNMNKFLPFSAFDKNIVSLKTGEKILNNLKFYYKEANKYCLPKNGSPLLLKDASDKYISNCLNKCSAKSKETIAHIAKKYYFDYHTLGILTKEGEKIPLQTLYDEYRPGSSVSHINNPFFDEYFRRVKEGESREDLYDRAKNTFKEDVLLSYYDDNFILYFSDEDDLTVEQMLKVLPNNPKHPLIGNGIVKIMKTMGWTEKGQKRINHTYYIDETIPIANSESFQYLYKKKYELSQLSEKSSNKTEGEKTKKTLNKRNLLKYVPIY